MMVGLTGLLGAPLELHWRSSALALTAIPPYRFRL